MDQKMLEFETNFSILEHYGTNVTLEKFITNPAIGRDEEIKKLILVLLTPEKSALLIGKPGIGKTAVVEGLAFRLQRNDVPEALRGYHIVNMKTASLLGTMPSGESKVQKMIDELKTKDKIILFIDEIHMLIGATDTSSVDFANIFKEGLGRGSIKVIGATTTEEYERYILRDKAFTRRFQKIDIPEPSEEEVVKIMMGTLPKFEVQTGRKLKYSNFIKQRIMSFIVSITSEYKRVYALGSRYPDVSLTLLKQAFSYTVYDNREYVDIFDIRKAIADSKNIYPDVIRKELVNFDKDFNDLMLEEKGVKEIEEWRKDEIAIQNQIAEQKKEDAIEVLEEFPQVIESKPKDEPNNKKIKKAKVGKINVSTGLKEKLNAFDNSKKLDELLFSTDMGTISEYRKEMPTEFFETEEITDGGADDFLFGGVQDVNYVGVPEEIDNTYRVSHSKDFNEKEEGDNMTKRERIDIKDQNFDKYHNFFQSQNPGVGGYDDKTGRNPVDDFLNYGGGQNIPNDNYENDYGYDQGQDYNQGYDNYPVDYNNQYQDPYYQGYDQTYNNQGYDQSYGYNQQYDNQNYGQSFNQNFNNYNQPYNNQSYDYGANQTYPQYDYNNNQNYNQPTNSPSFLNPVATNLEPQGESLFGAPMTSVDTQPAVPQHSFDNLVTNSMRIKNGKIVDEFPTFEKLSNLSSITANEIGDVKSGQPQQNMFMERPQESQSVFSGSMNQPQPGQFMPPNPANNFGPLPGTEPSFMGVPPSNNPQNFMMPGPVNEPYGQPVNNIPGIPSGSLPPIIPNQPQEMPNNMMPQSSPNSFGNNFMPNMDGNFAKNSQSMGGNFGLPGIENQIPMNPSTDNKKWKFIENAEQSQPVSQNNISFSPNNISPTINTVANQPSEGQFLDFGQLNKGKIKQEESNKYIGISTEPKPTVDLNIEGSSKEEKYFDDFFE